MGQQEVSEALESGEWMNSLEIAEKTNTNPKNVVNALRIMFNHGEVFKRRLNGRDYFKLK